MNRIKIIVPLVAFTLFSFFSFHGLAMGQPESEETRPLGSEIKPDLMGMPYDEAIEFVARDTAALRRIPGVEEVSVGPEGLYVFTDQPELLPDEIEGVPVFPEPQMFLELLSHTPAYHRRLPV